MPFFKTSSKANQQYQNALGHYNQWKENEANIQALITAKKLFVDAAKEAEVEQQVNIKAEAIAKALTVLLILGKDYLLKDINLAEDFFMEALSIAPDNMDLANEIANERWRHYWKQYPSQLSVAETQSEAIATKNASYINLVFQGGGPKGIAYLGAMTELFNHHIDIEKIERVGGASAGAINAVLLGLGYSLPELDKELKALDLTRFFDGPFRKNFLELNKNQEQIKTTIDTLLKTHPVSHPLQASNASKQASSQLKEVKKALELLSEEEFGLFPGDYFRQMIECFIQRKTGIAYATFKDLAELRRTSPNHGNVKDIYLVGANISTQQIEVFSHETTPDVIISDALRLSMSIPLVFKPHQVHIKVNGQRQLLEAKKGQFYVDGGLLDNYPNWLFDQKRFMPDGASMDKTPIINPYTLGLRLVSQNNKNIYEQNLASPIINQTPDGLLKFIWQICMTLYAKQESDSYKQGLSEPSRTIYIDHLNVGTTDFDIDDKVKQALAESGKDAVKSFFDKRKTLESQLLNALEAKDLQLVIHLLKQGVNPNAVNEKGQSCLDLALATNNNYLVLKLLNHGAVQTQSPARMMEIMSQAERIEFVNSTKLARSRHSFLHHHGVSQNVTELSTPSENDVINSGMNQFNL